MSLSELTPSAPKIDRILSRIEEGDIKIPTFQRGFVWDQGQIIQLLDSIYRDYPIGTILLWSSMERLKAARNVGGFLLPDRMPQYPVNYVLDGQQRLTTIYAIFGKNKTIDPNNTFKIDISIFDVQFDLDDQKFVPAEDMKPDHVHIKIDTLFDVVKFNDARGKLNPKYIPIVNDLLTKFNNYEISFITTSKRTKKEVGTIFERINNTGTDLSTLDLMIAWTWSEDFYLKEKIDTLLETLDQKGFGDTPNKIVLQCLCGLINKTTATQDILDLQPDEVKNTFEHLTESMEKAIDFLSTEFKMTSRDLLPHSHQLVPLTFFFSKINTPNAEQVKAIKDWFWKTSFSRRYSFATDEHMNEDISFMEEVLNNKYTGISKYSYSINAEALITQKFTKSSPVVRAFLLLLAQKSPLNLVNGTYIDLGIALSRYNLKEYHHIFPRKFLEGQNTFPEKISSLCNFTFLPSDSNKKISSKSPSDYIFNITPKNKYKDILESNLMSLKTEIYSRDDFEEFLKDRAQKIIAFLDSLIA